MTACARVRQAALDATEVGHAVDVENRERHLFEMKVEPGAALSLCTVVEWHWLAPEGELGATLNFYTVIGWHWRALLRDLHTNLAVVAVNFHQNDSVAHG
jgi:hypothetical protein